MDLLQVYVPQDRLHALAKGETLPEQAQGAALFADLSGFTILTETLVQDLGPQRGAEELLIFLDKVYQPLVDQVHLFGGSVLGFSGDAMTTWFDQDNGLRATACALAMQHEMLAFNSMQTSSGRTVSMGLKVAVATGSARRFLVGDPKFQIIDVLAGSPLERLANAEHHADRGEIILDGPVANRLSLQLEIAEWRADEATGEQFARAVGLKVEVEPQPWSPIPAGSLSQETLRPWLLPPVYQRLVSGRGEFLAELRPAVALFLRFGGMDFDADETAGTKLDAYIRQVQQVIDRYEGSLIQLTIGEKGSYLFAAFGAPIAHEDDARRAVSAAIELRRLALTSDQENRVQIGISEGRMRTGAYGSKTRRSYGVLGPQTNLAARLMQVAAPGQILVSSALHKLTSTAFNWEALPAMRLKGVAEPVVLYNLGDQKIHRAVHLQASRYSLPMIGRVGELAAIGERLGQALQGHGQLVTITGEAGMGKTRLMSEAIHLALEAGLDGYAGECHSYGTNTSYHLWFGIWRGFFNLDPTWSMEDTLTVLETRLSEIDPKLVQRLPLLGPVLNLSLPDNDLTRSLDAKRRKTLLEGLLVTCLRARARQKPILLALEDCHWLDPLSGELIQVIARSIANLPVLILMARRPLEEYDLQDKTLQNLPYASTFSLAEFTAQETQQLIHLKLAQLLGPDVRVPSLLVAEITRRSQGNPFYIEELLNYLKDKNIDPKDLVDLNQIDLPGSLHSLILTRIDQLTESQKITLKVASVIGRVFVDAWLWGAYPELGDPTSIRSDLDVLSAMDLTHLEKSDPELTYLFKHIITQEVAYESLPFGTRAVLHDQLGGFIERTQSERLDQYIDLLAYHFVNSHNEPKKQEYLLKAGQAAQHNYANQAAINYYRRLLPLLEGSEKVSVMLKLGQVFELVGKWDEARGLYQGGQDIAEQLGDRHLKARCQIAMGELLRKRGVYQDSADWLNAARQGFEQVADLAGVGQVLHSTGTLLAQQGNYPDARRYYEESLEIRRQLDDQTNLANLLNNLGILARYEQNDALARQLYLESLGIRRQMGDRIGITVSLNNLGIHSMDRGSLEEARAFLEEAVALQREIGDQYYLANFLNNLGNVARAQGDYPYASQLYRESLERNRELGDGWQIAYVLEDIGGLAAMAGQPEAALRLIGAAEALRKRVNASLAPHERARLDQFLESARQDLEPIQASTAWQAGKAMTMDQAIDLAFTI